MSEWYQLTAKVISQKGHCAAGHKVGDEFIIGDVTPKGMCSWAFYTLFPFASPLQSGSYSPGKKMQIKRRLPAPMRRTRLFSN